MTTALALLNRSVDCTARAQIDYVVISLSVVWAREWSTVGCNLIIAFVYRVSRASAGGISGSDFVTRFECLDVDF